MQTVERALELYGAPVYVRKEIVHNKHVVEQLRERGAIFVEELDDTIPEGATTVFSAHGVSPAVHADAKQRDLLTLDATCPLVTKVHLEAKKFAAEGYTIVLIGHAGHEEVEGTMGEAPERSCSWRPRRTSTDLEIEDPERIAYISQTTLSVDETRAIINRLRESFPDITGPRTDDICYATTNRQAAVKQMAAECDLVLVIGSQNSSNSQRLVEVARDYGADAHLIDNEARCATSGSRASAWSASLRRERARGARPAPRRVLPRPRHRGRRGVRGHARGRALHAARRRSGRQWPPARALPSRSRRRVAREIETASSRGPRRGCSLDGGCGGARPFSTLLADLVAAADGSRCDGVRARFVTGSSPWTERLGRSSASPESRGPTGQDDHGFAPPGLIPACADRHGVGLVRCLAARRAGAAQPALHLTAFLALVDERL